MSTGLRRVARWLVPVALADRMRARGSGSDFTISEGGWPDAGADTPPWEDPQIASTLSVRWPEFVEACSGAAPLDCAHEAAVHGARNMPFHSTYMTFGYVLARASRMRERISVMDWGGGIGHYYVLARALLPEVEFDYHIKDTAAMCEEGRRLLPAVGFHDSDDSLDAGYDLVMASGSLQYSSDWRGAAAGLAEATGEHLYLTRIPVFLSSLSVVVRQYAAAQGFNDDIVGWFLNREELVQHVESLGMELVRELYVHERSHVEGASEQPEVRGFLFRPRGA